MNDQWIRFAHEYLVDLNGGAAYVRAGYKEKGARANACRLLAKPEIQDLIAALKQERAGRLEIEADDVLRRLWNIATADTNEVIQYRRLCCRHCFGADFQYQRTVAEYERDFAQWEADELKASKKDAEREPTVFKELGGIGYNKLKRPNPDCPECFGEGIGDVFIPDTRELSPAARALYAGVKQTKEGLEVKLHSQDDALVNVGKHLGMFKEVHDHNHKGVIGVADISDSIAPDQRERIAAEMLREAGYEFDT
ncbi:phage terminase small subunit [Burkholderia sp. GAS332]|nr:phage terminase small subunit [Burkholderia sp. GAS332]